MEVRRTAPVKLVVSDEFHDDLHETAEQFLYCPNEASGFIAFVVVTRQWLCLMTNATESAR